MAYYFARLVTLPRIGCELHFWSGSRVLMYPRVSSKSGWQSIACHLELSESRARKILRRSMAKNCDQKHRQSTFGEARGEGADMTEQWKRASESELRLSGGTCASF